MLLATQLALNAVELLIPFDIQRSVFYSIHGMSIEHYGGLEQSIYVFVKGQYSIENHGLEILSKDEILEVLSREYECCPLIYISLGQGYPEFTLYETFEEEEYY